jgi:hypothetical protein
MSLIEPHPALRRIKVADSTPTVIGKFALSEKQSILASVRHNQLINGLTRVDCYSLENNFRTNVPGIGRIAIDEIYIGVHKRRVRYLFPVRVRTGSDKFSDAQIEKDFAFCEAKFPQLICMPIGVQRVGSDFIALFNFENTEKGVRLYEERHYQIVPHGQIIDEEPEWDHHR